MCRVVLHPGCEGLAGQLGPEVIVVQSGADVEVVTGGAEPVEEWVRLVLGGGRLVICGGEGRLLDALHFMRHCDGSISGAGWALGPDAVGGPRGGGLVVFASNEAALVPALAWICAAKPGAGAV